MKSTDAQKQPHASPSRAEQPFFTAKSEQAFFIKGKPLSKPFFGAGAPVQAKLTVGAVGDQYEQEADRVAAAVVDQIHSPSPEPAGEQQAVQRMGEEEEELQAKPLQRMEEEDELQMKPLQREAMEDEELQMKPMAEPVQRQGYLHDELTQGKFTTNVVPTQLWDNDAAGENRTGMPDHLKSGVEQLSGFDMSDVRVHYNSARPAQLNAYAYAQGTNIHLAAGQEKHLPHEVWHVVQQKQRRVQPTILMKGGVNVNDDPALECEAEVMGEKAATQRSPNRFTSFLGKAMKNEGGLGAASATPQKLNDLANPVQCLPVWRDNLIGALGESTVNELENKIGQTLKLYADQLQPRVLRSVIRAHSADRLRGPIMHLREAINANTPALDTQDLNYTISEALDAGWAHVDIATLIGTVNARNFGEWAHILINVANGAGWTATQTNTLIDTGHAAAGQLQVLAASAAGRGWSAADLAGAIAASNAQGIANWNAMDVAINEAEVSAAELTGSFAIQSRFQADKIRVGGRTGANVPHPACTTQVYNYPALPAPAQPSVSIYFAQGDLDHYKSGHSYPDFALTRGNIRRAPASTFFPLGSNIPMLANASIMAAGNAIPLPADGVYAGNQCMFHQMDLQNVRMDMCYPTGGDVVTRGTLLAVKAYVQP